MRFRWKPVTSFEDVTGDLEQLEVFTGKLAVLLDSLGRSPFLQLPSTEQQAIDCGQSTWVFTASQTSADRTVNHALGRTPIAIVMTPWNSNVTGYITGLNSSLFTTSAWSPAVASATVSFSWIAIG